MNYQSLRRAFTLCAAATLGSAAYAGFAGQTILGPISVGSLVSGNTTGKADDNDGFDSGTHIFNIWDGGDDVWKLIWTGGTMIVTLDSLGGADNDLFVYSPGSLDSTGDYSIVGAHDVVTLNNAVAGEYYINIDSTSTSEGAYNLSVSTVPEPATMLFLVSGIAGLALRRRKQSK